MNVKNAKITLLIASLFLFCKCQNISNEINKSFETVNNSIEKSNRILMDSLKNIHSKIDSNKNTNLNLYMKADSVYKVVISSDKYINNLKNILRLHDSSGANLGLAEKLLINTPIGEGLIDKLWSVSIQCYSNVIDSSSLPALNKALKDIREIHNDKTIMKMYFHRSTTVAGLMMLSKFQNDCRMSGVIVLVGIKHHLTK